MLQGECAGCSRNGWLNDNYLCPKCINKNKLTDGKMVKGGLNNKPNGNRPPAPPKQTKNDLLNEDIKQKLLTMSQTSRSGKTVLIDAIMVIDEQEKKMDILKNMTVLQLAQLLEDGLLHSCLLDENMSVLEFISNYLQRGD